MDSTYNSNPKTGCSCTIRSVQHQLMGRVSLPNARDRGWRLGLLVKLHATSQSVAKLTTYGGISEKTALSSVGVSSCEKWELQTVCNEVEKAQSRFQHHHAC
jgi:hypothetical protein